MVEMHTFPLHSGNNLISSELTNKMDQNKHTSLNVVINGNARPTTKLVNQFTNTAILIAAGLGPCEKSSAVIIHGIDPYGRKRINFKFCSKLIYE